MKISVFPFEWQNTDAPRERTDFEKKIIIIITEMDVIVNI